MLRIVPIETSRYCGTIAALPGIYGMGAHSLLIPLPFCSVTAMTCKQGAPLDYFFLFLEDFLPVLSTTVVAGCDFANFLVTNRPFFALLALVPLFLADIIITPFESGYLK